MSIQKKKEELRTNAYFYQEEDFVLYFLTRPEAEQESLLRSMLADLRGMNKVIALYKNRLSGSEVPRLSIDF